MIGKDSDLTMELLIKRNSKYIFIYVGFLFYWYANAALSNNSNRYIEIPITGLGFSFAIGIGAYIFDLRRKALKGDYKKTDRYGLFLICVFISCLLTYSVINSDISKDVIGSIMISSLAGIIIPCITIGFAALKTR